METLKEKASYALHMGISRMDEAVALAGSEQYIVGYQAAGNMQYAVANDPEQVRRLLPEATKFVLMQRPASDRVKMRSTSGQVTTGRDAYGNPYAQVRPIPAVAHVALVHYRGQWNVLRMDSGTIYCMRSSERRADVHGFAEGYALGARLPLHEAELNVPIGSDRGVLEEYAHELAVRPLSIVPISF